MAFAMPAARTARFAGPLRMQRGYVLTMVALAGLAWGTAAIAWLQAKQQTVKTPEPARHDAVAICEAADQRYRAAHLAAEKARLQVADARDRVSQALEKQRAFEASLAAEAEDARPVAQPNPVYIELSQRIAALNARRAELLGRLTPSHPTVVDLDGQIADLRRDQARVPELVAITRPQPVAPRPQPVVNGPIQAEIDAAKSNLEISEQELAAKTSDESRSAEKLQSATAVLAKLVQSEKKNQDCGEAGQGKSLRAILQTLNIPAPRVLFPLVILGAIFIAGAAALVTPQTTSEFTHVEQVAAELGLAVVGVLPAEPQIANSRKAVRGPLWSRLVLVISEVTVLVVLAWLIKHEVNSPEFALDLLRSPWPTLSAELSRFV